MKRTRSLSRQARASSVSTSLDTAAPERIPAGCIASAIAETLRRSGAGRIFSSFASAVTVVSGPDTRRCDAATRSPTAIATASSSVSSRGGSALPASSRYPPAKPGTDAIR